jgi:hypothetical protein
VEIATTTVEREEIRDKLSRGEYDHEQSARLANVLSRLLRQFEARRKALAPRPPSVQDYWRAKAAAEGDK